jgi:hypothetical protein
MIDIWMLCSAPSSQRSPQAIQLVALEVLLAWIARIRAIQKYATHSCVKDTRHNNMVLDKLGNRRHIQDTRTYIS